MLNGIFSSSTSSSSSTSAPGASCSTAHSSNGIVKLQTGGSGGEGDGGSDSSSLSSGASSEEPEEPPNGTATTTTTTTPRSNAQSPTHLIFDDDSAHRLIIEPTRLSNSKKMLYKLADHLLNLFVVTPLIVVYWASSWDIIYIYLFPDNLKLSYLITFAFANLVLLGSYFLQYRIQKFHDSLAIPKTYPAKRSYYNQSFLVRLVYTYVLTWAYVAQWRTYWDVYNTLTSQVKFEYFLAISAITLALYRYVLQCSFGSFTQMAPFRLQSDLKFNEYFKQAKIKPYKYKCLENITSFAYYELVEMIISVFVWKGVWDLFDSGADELLSNNKTKSVIFTLILGYSLYLILMIVERGLKSVKLFNLPDKKLARVLAEDVIYLLAYLSMVATWRSFWSGFDLLFLNPSSHRVYVIVGVHTFTFLVLFGAKLGSSLYGPAGVSNEPTGSEGSFSSFKLFDIRYFFPRKVR